MSSLHLSLLSESLGMKTDVNILLPDLESSKGKPKNGYKVLYLLHGYSGDYSDWIRSSLIENYVLEKPIVVVMPSGGKSFYTDMWSGENYWTYIAEELPDYLSTFLTISKAPKDSAIMGLSMGAYGALKLGFRKPERFSEIIGFSGVVDIVNFIQRIKENPELIPSCKAQPQFNAIFGPKIKIRETENDLFYLAHKINPEKCPQIHLYCGTEDFLLEDNNNFAAILKKNHLPATIETFEGGHEWVFWNKALKKAIDKILI